jgi:hypothetical protein
LLAFGAATVFLDRATDFFADVFACAFLPALLIAADVLELDFLPAALDDAFLLTAFFRAAMLFVPAFAQSRVSAKWRIIHSHPAVGSGKLRACRLDGRFAVVSAIPGGETASLSAFLNRNGGRQQLWAAGFPVGCAMFGDHGRVDAATHIKARCQTGKARLHGCNEIIENCVRDSLVEGTFVSKRPDVLLEGFEFHAGGFGYIVKK